MTIRICQLCHGQVREEDCATWEANVCPLMEQCVRPNQFGDEPAWPMADGDDDGDSEPIVPTRPVAPASV